MLMLIDANAYQCCKSLFLVKEGKRKQCDKKFKEGKGKQCDKNLKYWLLGLRCRTRQAAKNPSKLQSSCNFYLPSVDVVKI